SIVVNVYGKRRREAVPVGELSLPSESGGHDVLNAVLVGCGAMSRGWLDALTSQPELRERVALVGLVDLDRSAAERRKSEFGLDAAQTGSDLDAMLAATRPDLLFDVALPASR